MSEQDRSFDTAAQPSGPSEGFRVRLDVFEGPFDQLLGL
ncbi:MAG: hypothetical protein QOG99_762, partial [Frankiales bacterium]|nr:hypothetical protein [Frankiales bacterium]